MLRRVLQVYLVLQVIGLFAYAWYKNPAGCQLVGDDLLALCIPGSAAPGSSSAPADALVSTPSATGDSSASSVFSPAVSSPATDDPTAPDNAIAYVPLHPAKGWTAPAVIPAQANWTWTTITGKTYQNVIVTKIAADTVSIMHALGAADLLITELPPDLRATLSYDPKAAASVLSEKQREQSHPFYTLSTSDEAQTAARYLQWPVAWVSSEKNDLQTLNPPYSEPAELTQLILNYLHDKCIVIFINANAEMSETPDLVHHQFSQHDDGNLPGGANYATPKVVFTDPDATYVYGRVSNTRLKNRRLLALDPVLKKIKDHSVPISN